MANILLMPVGSHGDVHPFVALGQALQASGHAVTLITSAYFEQLANRARLPFVGIGTVAIFKLVLIIPTCGIPRAVSASQLSGDCCPGCASPISL